MTNVTQRKAEVVAGLRIGRPTEPSGYIPSLDGWRAIAIFLVLEAHNQPWSFGVINNHWLWLWGGRGVDLFFALSGFLICTRLLREEERVGAISLRSFYTRRLFRIQPAALMYLGVVLVLTLCGSVQRVFSGLLSAVLMFRNYYPIHVSSWETGHFWSLSAEEHFYLFLPGFLVLCKRYRLAILSFLVVAFDLWRVFELQPERLVHLSPLIFLHTDIVIDGILLGCVFAIVVRKRRFREFASAYLYPWVALSYAAVAFTFLEVHHFQWEHTIIISVFPILIVSTALHPSALTTRLLELPPVRFLGKISYSLYLWQQIFFNRYVTPAPHSFRSRVLLCWCVAFGCAIASYYLIESPMIKVGHKIAKRFDLKARHEARISGPAEGLRGNHGKREVVGTVRDAVE
jgi:peptidoglycan/LPS O-acetylase OafA/YrhL